jgi:hypothetical protein
MGVGFTGSLASSRPKHGDHRYALLTNSPLPSPAWNSGHASMYNSRMSYDTVIRT